MKYCSAMEKDKLAVELGRRGGLATKKKMGKDYYVLLGKKSQKKKRK